MNALAKLGQGLSGIRFAAPVILGHVRKNVRTLLVVGDAEYFVESRRKLDFNTPPAFGRVVAVGPAGIEIEFAPGPDD